MIVIGIDPGSIVTGVGIVKQTHTGLRLVNQCEIRTRASMTFNDKLKMIYDEIAKLVALYNPTYFALETIFFSNNVQSALKLGHVRGCVLALAINQNLNILEYSPKQVKRIITGNGNASKQQVAYMVGHFLKQTETFSSYDVTDAIALAISGIFSMPSNFAPIQLAPKRKKETWTQFLQNNPHKILNKL